MFPERAVLGGREPSSCEGWEAKAGHTQLVFSFSQGADQKNITDNTNKVDGGIPPSGILYSDNTGSEYTD